MTNSSWQIHRVGLVDFWYYDEEEFLFLEGRMLLRGANGSGKSVTMQSFIPLLLDGNLRPERLDPFGSRARKMENYLLEEGDGREERTGYLYMEFKREASGEYLTFGIGMRARRNKKMDTWYFAITDGRRVGKDIFLYRDPSSKITCTMRELKNRIGEGGRVMETQSEYAQCVNRLLFGFETQEEHKELIELLIQLRTPKLSKEFKPSLINEILAGSLQTLSEDDLRPMSEAIENMDSLKTNLEVLTESIRAAEQIERVFSQYNEVVLYDKAALLDGADKKCRERERQVGAFKEEINQAWEAYKEETDHYAALEREETVLKKERESLAGSDAARLKEKELEAKNAFAEYEGEVKSWRRKLEEREGRFKETERKRRAQADKNEMDWDEILKLLDEMGDTLGEIPFDDFTPLKDELVGHPEKSVSFAAHTKLLREYTALVNETRRALEQEEALRGTYSRELMELDKRQEEKEKAERELRDLDNLLHETKQELIEAVYRWAKEGRELCPGDDLLQEIIRRIEAFRVDGDYWEVREAAASLYDEKKRKLDAACAAGRLECLKMEQEAQEAKAELDFWKELKEAQPEREEAVRENRRLLDEMGIPYRIFYQLVDFSPELDREEQAFLEEALLRMGILDALVIAPEYREMVLSLGVGVCDHYIFTDVPPVGENLEKLLAIENPDSDILLYYDICTALRAVAVCDEQKEDPLQTLPTETSRGSASWVGSGGHWGMGILEGTVTGLYAPRFIGVKSRERYRMEKILELEAVYEEKVQALKKAGETLQILMERTKRLGEEWKAFPDGQDLLTALKEYDRCERKLSEAKERILQQKERVDSERKKLDAASLNVKRLCGKCGMKADLKLYEEAFADLGAYRELFTQLQLRYGEYLRGIENLGRLDGQLEEIDADLDDMRYNLGRSEKRLRDTQALLDSIAGQLKLTDYEKIRERLDYCVRRLGLLPSEKEASVKTSTEHENRALSLKEKEEEALKGLEQAKKDRDRAMTAFNQEYALGYVKGLAGEGDSPAQARSCMDALAGRVSGKRQGDLFGSLQETYHKNKAPLAEYQITLRTVFSELDEGLPLAQAGMRRLDIGAKYRGTPVRFPLLIERLKEDAETHRRLLSDRDRELFEDILANTISKKIRVRIQSGRRWVEKMNRLMETMKTSSGLTLSLRWKSRKALAEGQMDTNELVELLQKDAEIMRPEETQKLSGHFRSKIDEARKASADSGNTLSFHALMREVLDYRQWFEFQLESRKVGEAKKELTDRVFYTFSGGEKAMSMYVPLFSAVAAKYAGARKDAPHLISLDEAFAGVDEMNIRDMFRLMVEFHFNFMINSQNLWGDYDSVPALAIYQLLRPENAHFVTVIRYVWNGKMRRLEEGEEVQENEEREREAL